MFAELWLTDCGQLIEQLDHPYKEGSIFFRFQISVGAISCRGLRQGSVFVEKRIDMSHCSYADLYMFVSGNWGLRTRFRECSTVHCILQGSTEELQEVHVLQASQQQPERVDNQ